MLAARRLVGWSGRFDQYAVQGHGEREFLFHRLWGGGCYNITTKNVGGDLLHTDFLVRERRLKFRPTVCVSEKNSTVV